LRFLDHEMDSDKQLYTITEYSSTCSTYNIYINEQIKAPSNYNELFELLRSVGPHDTINFYLNCPGGNLVTGQQLINAMNECQAHIVTILDGVCMSLAPLILFSGDEIVIPDHGMIMFHDFSQGPGEGKGNELLSGAIAWNEFYKQMLNKHAKPFLTDNEIKQVVNGQDLYLDTTKIRTRIEKVMKKRAKQQEEKECPETQE
jgi:ATP-dependent protease ClpP protease subunit